DWIAPAPADVSAALAPVKRAMLKTSLGHYPALFAILDCIEYGLPQSFEGAIRSEMTSFSHLVLRPEPRAMIQTMFLGRVDFERLERKQELPDLVERTVSAVRAVVSEPTSDAAALAAAGFKSPASAEIARERVRPGYWVESDDPQARRALAALRRIHDAVAPLAEGRTDEELRVADYAAVRQAGFPAYLGGPFAFRAGTSSGSDHNPARPSET